MNYLALDSGKVGLSVPTFGTLSHTLLYTAAAVSVPALANAAIINVTPGSPLVVGNGSWIAWDIDGDSETDMTLFDNTGGGNPFCMFSSGAGAGWASNGSTAFLPITGASTVGPADSFAHFQCTSLSDATCGHTHLDGFVLFPGVTSSADQDIDFSGYLGFQFDNNGTTNYGVASFTSNIFWQDAVIGSFTINAWAYDNTGAAISGSALSVTEPETLGLASLGLLALGATGLRRRRQQPVTMH